MSYQHNRDEEARTDLDVLLQAEEAIGENLVWLTDALDLAVRQGHGETLRRLTQLRDAHTAICRQLRCGKTDDRRQS